MEMDPNPDPVTRTLRLSKRDGGGERSFKMPDRFMKHLVD
jgi:hypothetical protein